MATPRMLRVGVRLLDGELEVVRAWENRGDLGDMGNGFVEFGSSSFFVGDFAVTLIKRL